MKYYSTENTNESVDFRTALLRGLASDKGLFLPEFIPILDQNFIKHLDEFSFQEISFNIAKKFIGDEINNSDLMNIIESAISFEAPVVNLSKSLSILELFHGPTLAFKDFGARFMAKTMGYLLKNSDKKITILVATSGDTGSAVANGFLNVEGIDVVVLYPKNKVSKIQESQITTLGNNIKAIEIKGNFDDCQKLVKTAFVDKDLLKNLNLSSANSINIGRLIPQSFYYFESFKQIEDKNNLIYSVPSGNLGNLTAGLIAKQMGLPIKRFIAATNSNNVFEEYIQTGIFNPRSSVETISNAMDVGNPSNLERIIKMFNNNHSIISDIIYSKSYSDSQTIVKMNEIHSNYNYIIDPHGAVGCLAVDSYLGNNSPAFDNFIVMETAHPAKFLDVFKDNLDFTPKIPERLSECLTKESLSIELSNNYSDFKEYLLSSR